MAVILTCIFTACGDSDTGAQDEKPSQAHVHSYSEKNIESHYLASPATCTKKAKYYYSCSCGDSLFSNSSTFEYGDALGHSFTHYVSDNNATYEKDGTKTAKCDRCSETKTVVDKGSKLSYIEENFSLALVGNGYAITAYIGDLTNVHVPSTYQEKPIVSIETRAFYDCSKITEVSLPDTVNEIGEEAFGYCTSLKRIDISACKRIKGHAFIGCTSLTEMTIPNGVISIGEKPFAECSSLKKVAIYSGEISAKVFAGNKYIEEIILGENVTDIAQFAFAGCTALKQLTMPKVNDMQAFITYYFGLETYSYTLNGSGTNKIVPERVNTYVYETNGVQHIFGIPADDTNWYYDGDGIEVGGVYYKYTGRPVAVSSWKDYYEVTINRAYQLPLSWKAEFYYIPNLSLQELTITDQLISTKNDVFKGLTCKIDVKQKYPVKSVSLVGNTEVFLDEFSINDYMLRVEHTDGFVEDILFEEKYLQSDINDLKTEGEKTLSFVYDNVAGESILLLKLHIFENVSMDDALVSYDNMPKSLVVKGAPEGTTITYENNNQIEDGDYVVKATLVKPYYETKVLTATLSIRKEKYSIKYVFNNDEAVNDNPSEYRYGVATSLNIPSSTSGTFISWYEDENYSRSFKGITETTYGNLILYGKFSTIFTVSGNTITGLTDIGKKFTEIAIPQQINGTTIKNIADNAFKDCTGLTTVNWNATACTGAGSYSGSIFTGCSNLATVNIGDNVKIIPSYAFYNCSGLTSITIPDSVTSIGNSTFSGCTGLTSIIVDEGNTKYHSSGNCLIETTTKTLILGCKTSVIPSDGSVTSIGESAFMYCSGLTSIAIPDSVMSIGTDAFYNCNKLQNIYITDIAAWCNISGLNNLMIYGTSNKNLYINNELVTSVIIPDGVTIISSSAFRGCSGLTSVTIPNSVTSIGTDAFYNCNKLQNIYITDIAAWCNISGLGNLMRHGSSNKNLYINNELVTSVTIPDGVTAIPSYAFAYCSGFTSVTIPNSVTSIGSSTFSGCSGLTSITIPDSVTSIGSSAFENCSGLTSVTIGNGVTSIGSSAFSGCSGLTSVTIPNSVTSIGSSTFFGCTSLTSIIIPDSVTSIGSSAFNSCVRLTTVNWNATACANSGSSNYPIFGNCSKLTTINIGDNVTTIPSYAFYNCSGLTIVTIGNSVTSIGSSAFSGCSGLTTVNWNATTCTSAGSYSGSIFKGCSNLTAVNIGDNVTTIPAYAFYNCSGLTSVTIPDCVTSIGSFAFASCSGLTSIAIPNSVTNIGVCALGGCSSLKSITIPFVGKSNNATAYEAVLGYIFGYKTEILTGDYNWATTANESCSTSFYYSSASNVSGATWQYSCYNSYGEYYGLPYRWNDKKHSMTYTKNNGYRLQSYYFYIPASLKNVVVTGEKVSDYAFFNCKGLTSITISDSVKSIGVSAFSGCSGLTSITIPDSVTSIGVSAFSGCSGLTSITIPDSVTSIGDSAFSGCSGLTSITVPDSVTSIGDYAFSGCSKLQDIYITDIAAWCNISGLDNLMGDDSSNKNLYVNNELVTSITIPNGVTAISSYAFRNCSGLTSVTIGNGVTSIGYYAFGGCNKLQDIYITDIAAWCNISGLDNLMRYCASNKKLYINNELATSITIPDGVMSIGESAFEGYTGLTNVTIPDSVTSIGGRAFYGCSGLKTVLYAGTEEQWKAISIGSDNSTLTSAARVYNYDGTERTYLFVTNCEQSVDPIIATHLTSLPILNGYRFCGWYDNEVFEGEPVCAPYYSKDKTTLYAKWLTEEEWNTLHDGTSFEKAFIAESGKTYDVNVKTGGQIVYFAFTPTTSGSFTIQSTGSGDTYGTLYSSTQSSLKTSDDDGDGNNFKITYTMTAGTTYYVAVKFYGSSTTGTFKVSFS